LGNKWVNKAADDLERPAPFDITCGQPLASPEGDEEAVIMHGAGTGQKVRARTPRSIVVVAVGILLAAASMQVASGATTSKPYSFVVAPSQVAAGATVNFSATLHNGASPQQLGSANITIPTGFTIGALTPPSAGTVVGNVIQLRNLNIAPGQSLAVGISASVPCAPGAGIWQVRAKQSNDFSGPPGNDFALDTVHSQLSTTVVGSCHLNFATQPADAAKTVAISTTPFNRPAGGPVQVEVLDGTNARVTSSTLAITVGIDPASPNPAPGSALSGTLTQNAVAGVASFGDLSINLHGVYGLRATATGVSPASSGTFTIWDNVAPCSPSDPCNATVNSPKSETAQFSATSSTAGVLLLSLGQDAPSTLDCGDSFNHAPSVGIGGTYLVTATNVKTLITTIDKTVVQSEPNNGAAFYKVCFESDEPFVGSDGTVVPPGTPALLPDCKAVAGPPCLKSVTKDKAGDVVETVNLPADDSFRWR
jgi:hypothetical protein